VGCSDK